MSTSSSHEIHTCKDKKRTSKSFWCDNSGDVAIKNPSFSVKEIRNAEKAQHGIAPNNFCLCNHEPRVLESRIQLKESRIPLTIGIQNPSSFDKDPQSTAWDPESKTIPHFLRRGDRKEIGFLLILMYSRWRNLFFLVFFSSRDPGWGSAPPPPYQT